MNDQQTAKTILALLVVGKVLTRKKANTLYGMVELNFVRGLALPGTIDELVDLLEGKQ